MPLFQLHFNAENTSLFDLKIKVKGLPALFFIVSFLLLLLKSVALPIPRHKAGSIICMLLL
jgi:hypothetical protein